MPGWRWHRNAQILTRSFLTRVPTLTLLSFGQDSSLLWGAVLCITPGYLTVSHFCTRGQLCFILPSCGNQKCPQILSKSAWSCYDITLVMRTTASSDPSPLLASPVRSPHCGIMTITQWPKTTHWTPITSHRSSASYPEIYICAVHLLRLHPLLLTLPFMCQQTWSGAETYFSFDWKPALLQKRILNIFCMQFP